MAGRFPTVISALLGVLSPPLRAAEPVVLRTATTHPMSYYFALPEDSAQPPKKAWPVLVCVTGADADFTGLVERVRQARGSLPYVLVVPCTFSSTNHIGDGMLDHYRRLYPDAVMRDARAPAYVVTTCGAIRARGKE